MASTTNKQTIQWSKGFTGSTHDSTILSSSKFEEQWLTDVYLADGIFAASKNLLVPFRRPAIWPTKPCATNAVALQRLSSNEQHAHFRARIEHVFSAVQFNRFKLFHSFKRSDTLLHQAFLVAIHVLNWELLLRYGVAGRYAAVAGSRVELERKFSEAKNMKSRYPEIRAKRPRTANEEFDDE